jgi:hydroxymethylbilane synthase
VLEGENLWLRGLVGDPSGGLLLTAEIRGPQSEATSLGIKVAEELLEKGAGAILQAVYGEAGPQ